MVWLGRDGADMGNLLWRAPAFQDVFFRMLMLGSIRILKTNPMTCYFLAFSNQGLYDGFECPFARASVYARAPASTAV
jgi:hypothetical protein